MDKKGRTSWVLHPFGRRDLELAKILGKASGDESILSLADSGVKPDVAVCAGLE
jgi:hypothetical protein